MTDPHHTTPAEPRPPAPLHGLEDVMTTVDNLQSDVNSEVAELRELVARIRTDGTLDPEIVAAMDRINTFAQSMAEGADLMRAATLAARAETN